MHRIVTTIRRILPGDLPPGDTQALLNLGIVPLGNDFYSCIHQEERDETTLDWRPRDGQSPPGQAVTQGVLEDRHRRLPFDVKPFVMRARILKDGKKLASESLAQVSAALKASVGLVDGAPLIETETPEAVAGEAERLAHVPGSGVSRETVPMAQVSDQDLTEAQDLVPHSWAGEPRR